MYIALDQNQLVRIEKGDILPFLIPLFQVLHIPLMGNLTGTEAALLLIAPVLIYFRYRRLTIAPVKVFILLCATWLFGQALSDIINHSPAEDWTRGIAKILFVALNFTVIYLLIDNRPRRVAFFSFGIAIGGVLTYMFNPHLSAENQPWKFGMGYPITLLLVLLASYLFRKRHAMSSALLLLCCAGLNIALDSRSLGLICALSGTVLGYHALFARRAVSPGAAPGAHILLLLLAIAAAAFGIKTIYNYAASQNLLGEASRAKFELQREGDFGILLGGRSELLGSLPAIAEKPLAGHGSWAKNCKYAEIRDNTKVELGYYDNLQSDTCLIPTHSHIFGAWVESGIAGILIWLFAASLAVRVMLLDPREYDFPAPLVLFLAFWLLWDLFFSPLGMTVRYRTPYEIATAIFVLRQASARHLPIAQA